ncbi:MAG TPA: HAMP domain-containing sensor histidine kinase [Flavipsychrobacter sp.]|nr:HAMP domain-containing sensor histidine kinase [Flavipsychrobacter sp.]
MKIQYRIALLFAMLTVSIVLIVSVTEYYFANQNTFEDFYKRLEIRAVIAAKSRFENEAMSKSTYAELRRLHLEKLPAEKEYFLDVDSQQEQIAVLPLDKDFYKQAQLTGIARHREGNMFYYAYRYNDKDVSSIVIIAAKNEFIDAYLRNLRTIIVVSTISAIVLSLMIGLWFSKIILQPISLITHKVQDISASQLHLRLPAGNGKDEISELTETFNNMLDRLETTFETQKNFISNASHELNTPLTTIIGESEYALSKQRSAEDYVRSMGVILNESERLKRITGSLLHLAQTGYTGKLQDFSMLRLDEVLYTVKETVDNIIPKNKVVIDLSLMPEDQQKLVVKGNQQLLELALVNIVINGCKYSLNKPVLVSLAATDTKLVITIEDNGVGIPKEEIAYIYEPFFRASNTGSFKGYGIGLPLSRNIVRLHNGELDVRSEENKGTTVKIKLPLAYANWL